MNTINFKPRPNVGLSGPRDFYYASVRHDPDLIREIQVKYDEIALSHTEIWLDRVLTEEFTPSDISQELRDIKNGMGLSDSDRTLLIGHEFEFARNMLLPIVCRKIADVNQLEDSEEKRNKLIRFMATLYTLKSGSCKLLVVSEEGNNLYVKTESKFGHYYYEFEYRIENYFDVGRANIIDLTRVASPRM